MAKSSTYLKRSEATTFVTNGVLHIGERMEVETEDFGMLDLIEKLLGFEGKSVKITVQEKIDEELDFDELEG